MESNMDWSCTEGETLIQLPLIKYLAIYGYFKQIFFFLSGRIFPPRFGSKLRLPPLLTERKYTVMSRYTWDLTRHSLDHYASLHLVQMHVTLRFGTRLQSGCTAHSAPYGPSPAILTLFMSEFIPHSTQCLWVPHVYIIQDK